MSGEFPTIVQDVLTLIRGLDNTTNDRTKQAGAALMLGQETVATIKSNEPVTDSHALDMKTSSVTDVQLLEAFATLPDEEKVLLLNSALIHNKPAITAMEKHRMDKDMLWTNMRVWVIKVVVGTILAVGVVTIFSLIFLAFKDGPTKDAELASGIFSTFFKTLEEVLKIVFLTEK